MPDSFYGRLYAETYDIGDQRQEAVTFYLQQWERLGRPSPVLEPMCGTGFFLIPFLEASAQIDGLDSSPYMLDICRDKCIQRGYAPDLYQADIEQMELPRQYGLIFIPDRSFAHIYDKKVAQACLHTLANHIAQDGWFVVETKTPPREGEFGAPGQTNFGVEDRPDGSTIFSTSVWSNREGGRVIRNWTKFERYVQGQLIETEIFDYNERFYERQEFIDMLTTAGFANITTMRAYDGAQLQEHDVIVYSCQKL
jgi:hypothetical protein